MKALTIKQPGASLFALGVRTVETRSWSTTYRGPLAIHAGMTRPPMMHLPPQPPWREGTAQHDAWLAAGPWFVIDTITAPEHQRPHRTDIRDRVPKWAKTPTLFWPKRGPHAAERTMVLPLGAVVATCQLVDVVPTESLGWWAPDPGWHTEGERPEHQYVANEGQRPFGDFSPGRFAWLLEDVKPTTERCPACWGRGRTGGLHPDADVGVLYPCVTCGGNVVTTPYERVRWGSGVCEPVPARGRQGLWEWAA